jgi:hypothetical protein
MVVGNGEEQGRQRNGAEREEGARKQNGKMGALPGHALGDKAAGKWWAMGNWWRPVGMGLWCPNGAGAQSEQHRH